jgi:hypothetical protein
MSFTSAAAVAPLPVIRRSVPNLVRMTVRTVRPSVLDQRLRGDAWVVAGQGELQALCFDSYCLVRVGGLTLDVPSLNELLMRLRRPNMQRP